MYKYASIYSLSLINIEDIEDSSLNPLPRSGSQENGNRTPKGQAGHLPLALSLLDEYSMLAI